MTLGQRIQDLRKQHGLSQEALGEALGVTRQAISKWEGDQTIPDVDKLVALSKLFSIPVGQLLGVERESIPAPAPTKSARWLKIWLALLTAVCILLTGVLSWLWRRYSRLDEIMTRTEITEVGYTTMNSAPLFQELECEFSDIELGFPQNKGTQDLTVTVKIKPVEQLEGWDLLPLYVDMTWKDPWRNTYPVTTHNDDWNVEMKRGWDGTFTGSFTIKDYPWAELTIDACFQEPDTGLKVEIYELLTIESFISGIPDHLVETLEWEPGRNEALLPIYIAKTLPDPKYTDTFAPFS